MLKGSIVALVTPMHSDGTIDDVSLTRLIEWHLAEKTAGLVIAGTTGEGCTLTAEEQYELISATVKQVKGRIPVIAGTGSHSTQHTIELTQRAQQAGADAALIVTPYYNKPTQKGLIKHYKAIAAAVSLPIILYNVPGRTACDLLPETVGILSEHPGIIGIKEASGKPERVLEIAQYSKKNFIVYSGEDGLTLEMIQLGASGVISVTANIVPRRMHEFCLAALSGDMARADSLNTELMPLHKHLFVESNPIPVKWALHKMGLIPEGIRLPLLSLDSKYHAQLMTVLQQNQICL